MKIFITVKPRSREEKVIMVAENHYLIHIKALPEKGKANMAVIKSLSKYFHTTQSHISIISGFTSSKKVINIANTS